MNALHYMNIICADPKACLPRVRGLNSLMLLSEYSSSETLTRRTALIRCSSLERGGGGNLWGGGCGGGGWTSCVYRSARETQ